MEASFSSLPFHVFDEDAELQIVYRRLPHWSQAGTICFITWRTADSMPQKTLETWYQDRSTWLKNHDIDPASALWRDELQKLEPPVIREFLSEFWNRWHDELDASHGTCVLRKPELARIVAKSLHHFDSIRYLLFDFVVMPNHVHLLASFPNEHAMLTQCESWKHYMATRINKCLGRDGRFWQKDAFDHLVRSDRQFDYLRKYIADNPKKAGLPSGEYLHYTKRLGSE